MKRIKIGLVGASGRMGQEIIKVINSSTNCEYFYSMNKGDKPDSKKLSSIDVWIDFSSPEALESILNIAAKNKTPVVCGTTGLSPSQKKLLNKFSKKMPILWSSNMSLGVAVLNEALKVLGAISHFDFQIEEFHHIKKKDKPSGTAITLQENLEKSIGKKLPEPIAIRGGGIFGIHKVYAMSDEEILTFEHTALNRTVFAKGAVQAAVWLSKVRTPGLYQMKDVLFE